MDSARSSFAAEIDAATIASPEALRESFAQLRDAARAIIVRPAGLAFDPGALTWLERFPLPTIAAFDGELAGPAFELALACDIRICDASARLRVSGIGSRRLLTLAGLDSSVDILRARGRLDAEEALRIGLVSEVAPEGQSLAAARRLAGAIAARGPIATELAGEAIWRGLELPLEQALRFETDLTLLLQTTKDRAEGVRAFLEKRQPHFTGE